jgi:hypothetical protein
MVAWLLITRILVDGAILTAIDAPLLVLALYINPRLALSDYPADVRAAVPPRTKREVRQGVLLAIPGLLVAIGVPLYSTWLLKQQNAGELPYWMAFATILGVLMVFSLFDLIVLDLLMFYRWTPRFLVIPGTEGMAGYKDWRPHLKSQLTKGNALLVVVSALLALVPAFLY